MADGFLIFRFATEETVLEVIEKGPWMIGGKNIILQKWTPKFQFDRSRISALPVWVRLRGLPLPLWTKEGLSMVASMLGKPLSCNEKTISCCRLDYARLCVELDARLPFVHKFEVESPITEEPQLVRVEYEWKPPRCMKCHSFGHNYSPQTEHIPTNKLREEEMQMEEPTEPAKGRSHPRNPNPNQEKEMSVVQATNNHTGSTSSAPKTKKITTDTQGKENKRQPNVTLNSTSCMTPPLSTSNKHGKEPLIQVHHEVGEKEDEATSKHQSRPSTSDDDPLLQTMTVRKKKGGPEEGKGGQGPLKVLVPNNTNNFMIILGSWNIRGLNSRYKQKIVQQWVAKNNLELIGILEPRFQLANNEAVQTGLGLQGWNFISSYGQNSKCRILLGWNPQRVSLQMVNLNTQWVTCDVVSLSDSRCIRVTMVYALNTPAERTTLWQYLLSQQAMCGDDPWVVLGHFNGTISTEDRHGGDTNWYGHMDDFPNCINQDELLQISAKGLHFTWHNGQQNEATILRKLDWAFANRRLLLEWPQAAWATETHGNTISRLTTKLRVMKGHLSNLHRKHTNHIFLRVKQAQERWQEAQMGMEANPNDLSLSIRERDACKLYNALRKVEESLYKQRSKVQWLKLGDKNTTFFHHSVLHRRHRNAIHSLRKEDGVEERDREELGKMAASHFKDILSTNPQESLGSMAHLYPSTITPAEGDTLQ
ncbi:GLYCINE-RICH CELL WALL STRUCTURAL PROTEIN 1.8-LIKE [Salix viminalis]|uniref:GLYCINE-RICH CELL WALL STRUCTURAL PROTEIN 1.8-LIKE n=1 Tax=Salix viminalis TaxID=40686 RepID=A0A9Q0YYU2_SALVM|nr:GLYCINE-RICH CELL WALL STRUCTURAL PROTEIN 1.8-LIKE [Salix viminalis]